MYSCEIPKPQSYTIASARPLPYSNHTLKWHIVNFSPDLPHHEQIMIFSDVFAHYNYQLWPLRHLTTEKIEEAYIRIAFVEKDLIVKDHQRKELFKCPFDFNLEPGTLAVAYPRHGGKYDGWIFVNEEYMWSILNTTGKVQLYKVLIHEVGHLLGLGHTDKKGDIMYFQYNPANKWTSDSIEGINTILGVDRIAAAVSAPEADIFMNSATSSTQRSCSIFVKRDMK